MSFQKNTSGQKWLVFAFDRTTNAPKTGDAANITAKIRKDYTSAVATNDVNPDELEDGYYEFTLTQAESNATVVDLFPESATANIQVIGVPGRSFIVPTNFPTLGIASDGDLTKVNTLDGHTAQTGDTFALANGATGFAAIDTVVDAILVDTAEIGAAGAGLTAVALADVTSDAVIADAIWNAATITYGTAGTYGEHVESLSAGGDATEAKQDLIIAAVITNAAGADIAADIIALKAETALIVADTNELQTDWADGGRLDLIQDIIAADVVNIDGAAMRGTDSAALATSLATAQLDLDTITGADGVIVASGTQTFNMTGSITGNLSGSVGSVTGAVGSVTGSVGSVVGHTPQTGDTFALANGATGFAAIDTVVDAILVDTAEIGAAGAGLTALGDTRIANLDATVSSRGTSTLTQTQVTGGAYALNSASFEFNAALDFTTTQKAATLARVTLVDTTTTNTDMRGTDSAALAATALSTAVWTAPPTGFLAATFPTTVASTTNITAGTIATVSGNVNGSVGSVVGHTPQTGDTFALANGATGFAAIDTVVDAILVDTAEIGAAGAGLTAVPWNAVWDAEVQSEVDDALVAQRLDELLNADSDIDGAAPPAIGSVFHELMTKTSGSFTFDQTTDSLEALRDRGDAAWSTATGFSTHSAADVWAVGTRVLTAGTNIVLAKGVGVTGFNDIAATDIVSAGAITTLSGAVVNVGLVDTLTTYTGNTVQTGDAFARLGAPVGASVSADVAAVKGDTAATLADTNELQTDWANGGRLDLIVDAILVDTGTTLDGKIDTIDGIVDAILVDTDATIPSLLPILVGGTADSGTTTTMVDAARTEADTDFWAGSWIRFTSGTINGQTRLITAFSPGTDTITFAPATTQAIGTNTYEILPAGKISGVTLVDTTTNNTDMRGTDDAATAAALSVAQADLDTITGSDGVTLATAQGNYAPSKTGDQMDLVNAPNATAVTAIQNGLATPTNITAGTITTVTNLTNAPTSGDLTTAMKASVNTEVDSAIETYHLDHLLAATYDPASKPGVSDALLNELIESDGGVSRYTANALEQAPTGGSAPTAADIRAEIDSNSTQLAAILADTNELQTNQGNWLTATGFATPANVATELATYDGPTNAEMVAAFTEIKGATWATTDTLEAIRDRGDVAWLTATGFATTNPDNAGIAAIKVITDQFVFTVANQVDANALSGGGGLDAAGVRSAIGLSTANLDTQLGDLPTNAELATALSTADDATLAAIAALNNLSAAAVYAECDAAISDAALATAANLAIVAGYIDTEVAAIKAKTDQLTFTVANQVDANALTGGGMDAAATRAALGLASANLDTQLGDLPTNAELATALDTADDATLAAIAALNDFDPAVDVVAHVTLVDTTTTNTDMRGTDGANTTPPPSAATISAAVMAETGDTGVTVAKAIEMLAALAAGKVSASSLAGVTTLTYKKRDGTTTSFTVVVTEFDKTRATTGSLS